MANQFLALSMFIMLLSFFIVLNAVSNFQDMKSRPVLESLALAFSSKEIGEQDKPSYEEKQKEAFKKGTALDNIGGLFEGQIAGIEIQQNRLGTEMRINVPMRYFEKSVLDAVQGGQGQTSVAGGNFLPTLVSMMKSDDAGLSYRMDMVVNLKDSPAGLQNQDPQRLQEPMRRIGIIAQQLEQAGLPKKLYSSGLGQGKSDTVDLYFRRYQPFNPLGKRKETEESGAQ